MKKQSILLLLTLIGLQSVACDFCNCYLGLNPHYKKNIIGIRYTLMHLTGTHHDLSEFRDAGLSDQDFLENRSIMEVHGQWYPVQKLQVLFDMPYMDSKEEMSRKASSVLSGHHHSGTGEGINHGVGDPVLLVHYQLLNRTANDSARISHRLFAGAGLKFPVGSYKLGPNGDPLAHSHQPGSGSWDYLFSAAYLAKLNRVGLNVNASYMLTGMNSEEFEYGNRFNMNAIVYYQVNSERLSILPSAGAYFEQAEQDWNLRYYIGNSGGSILYAHGGLDVYLGHLNFTLACQKPIIQQLRQPQPESQWRLIAGVSVSLN